MAELRDLQVHVNGEQTFFIQEHIITAYSARMKKMIKQAKRRTRIKNSSIEIDEFPGGPDGFELVSRFCYNKGRIEITVWNVSLLHCCAIFLGMTEKISAFNLLRQTEMFLEGMFCWSWDDILVSLKSCESFFTYADSCGLLQKLVCAVLGKIAQNSSVNITASSSSSSSSPESVLKPSKSGKEWWFDDMSKLPPKVIEKVVDNLGAYGPDNNSLILTRFLLHYLRSTVQSKCCTTAGMNSKGEYTGLADTAIHGVISVGSTAFSCRKLFWVLGIVSSFSLSRDCRVGLERLIGEMLDQATLDDLLVSGRDRGVYDVSQVIRLLRVFVNSEAVSTQKMKKVGRLIDKYLGEISPDHNLKMSKFLGVVESLPDSARDCFDGVYRALDIYLESHPTLSLEERSRLCRCLNYEKLTLEACKELAKNPRIPPNEAVQALISQHSRLPTGYKIPGKRNSQTVVPYIDGDDGFSQESKDMKLNLQKMQWRVVELEKVCKEMKGHMSRLSSYNKNLPRFC